MIDVIEYIIGLCNNLIYLLADERLEAYLGAPLIWILIAFFLVWVVANIFILRPLVGGSIVSGLIAYNAPKSESKPQRSTKVHSSKPLSSEGYEKYDHY